uniref:Remorin C-terminal domain-containing protein n=1 Tax=Nelumbo nucifera TaxID=4432 RepID=A0A822ZQC2_NELNU|nr:TPA_asm: hypothetical protein HUJ06_017369 [Nelumbo nucifera]
MYSGSILYQGIIVNSAMSTFIFSLDWLRLTKTVDMTIILENCITNSSFINQLFNSHDKLDDIFKKKSIFYLQLHYEVIWYMFNNLAYLNNLNRADKKLSAIGSWENSKKASVEAQLRKVEVYHSHNSSYVQKIEVNCSHKSIHYGYLLSIYFVMHLEKNKSIRRNKCTYHQLFIEKEW